MMRDQALSFVNEIKAACASLSKEDIKAIEIKRTQFAVGYTIVIRSFLNSVCKHQVVTIAKKYRLTIDEKDDGLMLFQPKRTDKKSTE